MEDTERVLNAFEEAAADLAQRKVERAKVAEARRKGGTGTLALYDWLKIQPRTTGQVSAHFNMASNRASAMLMHLVRVGKARSELAGLEEGNRKQRRFTALDPSTGKDV